MTPPVRSEQNYFRHKAASERHRFYGWNSPCCDIDAFEMVMEYDNARAVAILEHKRESEQWSRDSLTIRALTDLANRAGIIAAVVMYQEPTWAYRVYPLNQRARSAGLRDPYSEWTERQYVTWLYKVRNREIPSQVWLCINSLPWAAAAS